MTRPSLHILLIEDNAEDCADMRQMLLQSGRRRYNFSEARLGAEGVRKTLASEHGPVDCVLLDYALPDMDALEVLAALCQGNDITPCPVVVITGALKEEGRKLMRAGAQDYIGKRWANTESLTRSIDNAIDRFELQRERKLILSALTIAKTEAERASRAKSDFLLHMSHELRSPLNVILGFTQLLEAGTPKPTPTQQSRITQVLTSGWYLLGLINDVLELTSIESGDMSLTLQSVTINDVVNECLAMLGPQALANDITLYFPDDSTLWQVQAEPSRVKQVLINLLTNAIKYNRKAGSITVRCSEVCGHGVRVSVEDTGQGLSESQMAELFTPFNRLGQETSNIEGTGVGLAISKNLVEWMGGHIGVDSNIGVGSCFWFELQAVVPPLIDARHGHENLRM